MRERRPTAVEGKLVAVALLTFALLLSGCSTKSWTAKDWTDKGYSLSADGKYREAVAAYTQAIEKDQACAVAYENRGHAHSLLGNHRQALEDLTKALALKDPRVPERDTYREIGVVSFRMGKYDDAIAAWKKALGKVKDDPGILNNIAAAYLGMNQVDKAAQAAIAAYAVDPSMPEVLNTMGEVAMARKEYRQAAEYFIQAISRDPSRPAHYLNAALALEKLRQYDKAAEYVNTYVRAEQDVLARQKGYELQERLRAVSPKSGAGK